MLHSPESVVALHSSQCGVKDNERCRCIKNKESGLVFVKSSIILRQHNIMSKICPRILASKNYSGIYQEIFLEPNF